MSSLGVVQLFLLAVLLFASLAALVSALAYPALRPRLAGAAPETRVRLFTAWLAAPLVGGVLFGLLCFGPGLLGLIGPAFDHCLGNHHGHQAHLCFVHPPVAAGWALGWFVIIIALGLAFVSWGRQLRAALAARSLLARLVRGARPDPRLGVLVVDVDRPFAVATNWHTLISRRLVERLADDDLAAVAAHERAHLSRRDALRKLVVRAAAVAHLPPLRRLLLADLELAIEQTCDEQAAIAIGDRLRVAQALLTVERLMHDGLALPAPAFSGSSVVARVESLLAPRRPPRPLSKDGLVVVVALLVLLPSSEPLHHAVEHLVDLVG